MFGIEVGKIGVVAVAGLDCTAAAWKERGSVMGYGCMEMTRISAAEAEERAGSRRLDKDGVLAKRVDVVVRRKRQTMVLGKVGVDVGTAAVDVGIGSMAGPSLIRVVDTREA